MENLFVFILQVVFGLLALTVIAFFIYTPLSIIWDIVKYIGKEYFNSHIPYVDLKPKYRKTLEEYFLFYKLLSRQDKPIFRKRLAKFIAMKEFVPRGELDKVTDEMKTLIGASAIQITFGLPNVYFLHFYKILVYPDSYYSEIYQRYHQGEVNTKGVIVLSWKNFVKGYVEHNSGRNLGLHEMAHALHIENAIQNEEFDFLDFEALKEWNRVAKEYIEHIRSGGDTFMRKYAGTNTHEFFAVMIEHFFEQPYDFKEADPHLYRLACRLLNQDPLLNIEVFKERILKSEI